MSTRPPFGTVTRGTTNPNRLRRADRWLTGTQAWRLTKGDPAPVVVDLGYGGSGVTTAEWRQRLVAVRPDVEVVGLEIDPARVEAARRWEVPGLRFAVGGFEVPLPQGRRARVVRAFNVLRQYEEDEVAAAWAAMTDRLDEDGIVVDGTCSELGRLGAWVMLDRDGPVSLTLSWRLRDLGPEVLPSVVAERLPKVLIHRNVPGEPVHDLLQALDAAWLRSMALAPYGARQQFTAAVESLRADWPVAAGPTRWRLGEMTVPWACVAPTGRPGQRE